MSEETPQKIKILARSDPNESRSDRTTLVTSALDVGILRDLASQGRKQFRLGHMSASLCFCGLRCEQFWVELPRDLDVF